MEVNILWWENQAGWNFLSEENINSPSDMLSGTILNACHQKLVWYYYDGDDGGIWAFPQFS